MTDTAPRPLCPHCLFAPKLAHQVIHGPLNKLGTVSQYTCDACGAVVYFRSWDGKRCTNSFGDTPDV